MNPPPAILTNLAFHQSAEWRESVTTICRGGESPDGLGAWRQAVRLLRNRPRFDVVVTMGPRPSLAYGVLCALLHIPSRQIMTEIFLDPPRPSSLAWRLKTGLFRWVARRALGILTNSSAEVALIARRFGIPESNLRFVLMYTTIPNPGRREEHDGSVVSVGRTARDMDTLLQAARRVDAPVLIVAGARDSLPEPLPGNVRVFREVPLDTACRLLAHAAVAVVPLQPIDRSTGQVFFFEAMAMGKPVVATRCIGTVDYIRHGENGLLVEPGNPQELADAVNGLLRNPERARRLADAALADCIAQWMPDHHAQRKLAAIASLWRASTSSGEPGHA